MPTNLLLDYAPVRALITGALVGLALFGILSCARLVAAAYARGSTWLDDALRGIDRAVERITAPLAMQVQKPTQTLSGPRPSVKPPRLVLRRNGPWQFRTPLAA